MKKLFNKLFKRSIVQSQVKNLYENPDLLVDVEFSNRTNKTKSIWVELACVEIDVDPHTEYRILTHDRSFHIAFDSDDSIIFYLQYSFGFKLYKRPVSKTAYKANDWILDYDISHIN